MNDKDRMARAICSAWPKVPDGCAAVCMDRLVLVGRRSGRSLISRELVPSIPPEGCKHASTVHGARAEAILGGRLPAPERYRHKKRGSVYGLVCTDARFQFSGNREIERALEYRDFAIYQDEETGKFFIRPAGEFKDGRFEPIRAESSLGETFEAMQTEERVRELRLRGRQVMQFLAGALCCTCGEQLGDGEAEIIMDDTGRTMHKDCERDVDHE